MNLKNDQYSKVYIPLKIMAEAAPITPKNGL